MKIQGFFSEISSANDAVKELQKLGFKNAFVDINDHYIENRNVSRNVAGTTNSTSLSELVLYSSSGNADEGSSPLAASDPMVSGFGSFDEVTDINYVVRVDTDNENSNKAKEILTNMGAELDNPNINTHKLIVNSDFDLEKAISDINDNI
jgi:hypothetical protein